MINIFPKKILRKLIIGCTFMFFAGYCGISAKACETENYSELTDYNDSNEIDSEKPNVDEPVTEYTVIDEEATEEAVAYDASDDTVTDENVTDNVPVQGINEELSEGESSDGISIVAGATYIRPVYNGIDYSAVYDFDYYIEHNPDIKKAYGDNQEAVLAHFVNHGMSEGRQGNASFNVYSYAYKYPDLRRAYGNNLKDYYIHYINNGKKEGRIAVGTTSMQGAAKIYNGVDYSTVYDYNYYTAKYSDIKRAYGLNDEAVLAHFVKFGMNEGRQAKESFNVTSYKNSYKDLRLAFMNNTKSYYMHYINNGIKEGRKATGNTEITDYVTSYNGVDYSSVYDFKYYTDNYSDIKNKYANDDVGALIHFVKYGMSEGRQGSASFDVWSYGYSYSDLRKAFGNNLPKYYQHYINNGRKEGRNLTNGVTSSNNEKTVYADYDFSSIYDIVYYTSHNRDVRNAYKFDDAAILEHFAQFGLKEGRSALASYSSTDYETAKTKVAEYNKRIEEEKNKIKYPKAVDILNQIGWDLNTAFNWAAGLRYYSGVSKVPDPGINYFGNYGFDNRKGNCYVLAAVFYEMAYSMGYNVRQISGTVPLAAGGQGPHSWVEIDINGTTYVFDPDFTNYTKKSGFKFTYGTSGTWIYNKIEVMHE